MHKSRYNNGVSIRIREFQQADFDILWQIDQACFDPQLAYSRAELELYMRRPGAFTLVAEAASSDASGSGAASIRGFIVAEARRRIGHIITIDVVPEARRDRIGSTLLDAAENRLLQAGATLVNLETPINNLAAIRFYRKKGYFVEKTVTGYYSGRLDALVMTKKFVPPTSG
jgi:ribosomal-protein-alanine N-acetyltransferase